MNPTKPPDRSILPIANDIDPLSKSGELGNQPFTFSKDGISRSQSKPGNPLVSTNKITTADLKNNNIATREDEQRTHH